MSNYTLSLWYGSLSVMVIATLLLTLTRYKHKRLTSNIVFQLSMLLGWLLCEFFYNVLQEPAIYRFFFDLKFAFIAFFSLALLLFVLKFYSFDEFHTPVVVLILSIIPLATTLIAVTSMHHTFLRKSLEWIHTEGYHALMIEAQGVWFWIHSGFCYILMMTTVFVALTQYRKIPSAYKRPSQVLIIGVLSSLVCNCIFVFLQSDGGVDISLVSGSLISISLLFSVQNSQGLEVLNRAKDDAFNELEASILLLDDEGAVINRNLAARYLLYRFGLDPEESSYDTIITIISDHATKKEVLGEGDGVNYILLFHNKTLVFNHREKVIVNKKGQLLATLSIFKDVSEDYKTIQQLEEDAGIDAMTGLLNRRSMEEQLEKLDINECLPLSIIIGDLNNLKEINDAYGHQQGDALLRAAAEGLISCSPPNSRIARTSGDEFLVAIPNYSADQTKILIDEIKRYLKDAHPEQLPISIALGTETKSSLEQDLNQVLKGADLQMYQDKTFYKNSQLEERKGG